MSGAVISSSDHTSAGRSYGGSRPGDESPDGVVDQVRELLRNPVASTLDVPEAEISDITVEATVTSRPHIGICIAIEHQRWHLDSLTEHLTGVIAARRGTVLCGRLT